MKPGFYTIMSAQFFSSLADNALLIAAISMLASMGAPGETAPMLKLFFTASYVLLAAFVGAFADARPKGRVMFLTNSVKLAGCLALIGCGSIALPGLPDYAGVLLAYALVGVGAAAYSPAKYGILTELLPPCDLVKANGWIEGLTVGSIVLGTVIGGALISPQAASLLLSFDALGIETGVDTPAEAAMCVIVLFYAIAAALNLRIPDTGAVYPPAPKSASALLMRFAAACGALWRDDLGKISLAVTTLFWGAGATLQFLVLKWASVQLGMPLHEAALLQGVVAAGIAAGAVGAARWVSLKSSLCVLPVGAAMGLAVCLMAAADSLWEAIPLLVIVGAMGGFFVVPMNALLQHRGHKLLSAGQSIAVQNFNENLSILCMLALYALMISLDLSIGLVSMLFGGFVFAMMLLVMRWRRLTEKKSGALSSRIEDCH